MVSGFSSGFFNIHVQVLEFCCISHPLISAELCNKVYFVKIDVKPVYFSVVAAKWA